jgi:hypothetical protein
MQEVYWDENLSSMSQNPDFYIAVDGVFSISRRTKLFHPNDVYVDPLKLDFVEPYYARTAHARRHLVPRRTPYPVVQK